MDETRRARLGNRILHELSDLLMRGDIKDHRVSRLVSFSFIKLAKDGSTARIGVSSFLDHRTVEQAVLGLNSAAGFLQSRVGKVVKTQVTPRLYFVADYSIEEGQAIINRIDQLEIEEDAERDTTAEQTDRE